MAERGGRRGPRAGAGTTPLLLRLQIEALADSGEGIARVELEGRRRAVFVPMTAPGDLVTAEVRTEGNVLRGRVVELLEASTERTPVPCAFAIACGGCDWMHLSLQAQRQHHLASTKEALSRALPAVAIPTPQFHPAQRTEQYRTRVRLGVRADARAVVVGFRAPRSRALVEVDTCMIASRVVDDARGQVSSWLAGSQGAGEVIIAQGVGGLAALVLEWQGELASGVFSYAERQVLGSQWAGVEIRLKGSRAPAVIGEPASVMVGFDGRELRAAPGGFMQAHAEVSRSLVEHVAGSVEQGTPTLELFCGAGNITVALAARAARLEAVEGDARAVEAARWNLASRGIGARVMQADANAVAIASWARTMVLDPPRVGAPEVSKRIAEASRVRRVVMVSCDQPTMVRDLVLMGGGASEWPWAIVSVDLFEMFPHTSHIETVVVLDRRKKGDRV